MSSPQIPFNFTPVEPSLTDALNLLKRDVMLNLNCHHIGTIQSFNANQNLNAVPPVFGQTASATINYPKTYFQLDEATGLYSPVLVSYQVLLDCPVIVLGGGNGAVTFPVKTGDECLVLFNDRDLDNWFQGGAGAALATPRLHSFSDGIILVGLRSKANVLSTYDLVRAILRGGSGVVGVNTSGANVNKILISNATPSGSDGNYTYATSLGTMLASLLSTLESLTTTLSTLTVSGVTSGSSTAPITPSIGSTIAGYTTDIMAVATALEGLLE